MSLVAVEVIRASALRIAVPMGYMLVWRLNS